MVAPFKVIAFSIVVIILIVNNSCFTAKTYVKEIWTPYKDFTS